MTITTKVLVILVAALSLSLAVLLTVHDHDVAARAVAEATVVQATAAAKAADQRADSAEHVLRVDTVVVTQTRQHYTAVHDTVLAHLTDTVLVKQFVQAADTTIHACTRALHDCEAVTAALRAELVATNVKVRALDRLQPSFLQRHQGPLTVLVAAASFVAGTRIR